MNNKLKKVVVWRLISFTVASIISYWYLGEFKKSFELTLILTVVMTTLHYFYEEFWERKTI
tara:strand:- start:436 stop:618 length:183 start_codon:yes stop_codon:yes gene_type:complete